MINDSCKIHKVINNSYSLEHIIKNDFKALKRILLLIPQNVIPATDGGKQSIFYPMQMLAKHFVVSAVVFVGRKENPIESDYTQIKVKPYFLKTDKSDNPIKLIINVFQEQPFKFNRYFSKKNKKKVLELCSEIQPDLIICHHAHLSYYGKLLKKSFPKIKLILREHNVEYIIVKQFAEVNKNIFIKLIAFWQFYKMKQVEIKAWSFFDNVLFISNSDLMEAKKHVDGEKYILLSDGSNLAEINPKIKANAILFSGNLSALQNEYNFNFFIKNIWIPFCENKKNSEIELWVTGNSVSDFELKTSLSRVQQTKFRIKVLGFVENISEVIQSAKYFLSPTIIGAGIRLKVLEAACNGSVIFCTPVDYNMLPDFVDLNNIVLYDSFPTFIEKLEKLDCDNFTYSTISNNIYDMAAKNLTWRSYEKRYLEIIENVILKNNS